jgi:hypothetical protein
MSVRKDIEAADRRAYLQWIETKRKTHYRLSEVLASLPAGTWLPKPIPGIDEPALSADGTVWFTLIFKELAERQRFRHDFHGTWITADDRSCFMSYENTWRDVNGWGLTLTSSDYPIPALGRRRNSELRTFVRPRRRDDATANR